MRLSGRFGRFGGCYVPEILVPGARAARGRVPRCAGGPGIRGRAQRPARQLRRAADAADPLPQPAGQHLSQARGPAPRRRAQDQPGAGPGPARQAHGQDPADRRDRRRPARRRDRDRRRAARLRNRHLHGRGGRRAAAAQRLPDGADGRARSCRSKAAAGRSRTRSTRRCATGRRASRRRIICSARRPGRTRSRRWCANSSA